MVEHEHPLLSYRELISELKLLISQRATGVMFITTKDNHAVQIRLEKGTIFGCRFRNKSSIEALPMIMEMEAGHYSFNPGKSGSQDTTLPATDELLRILTNSGPETPTDMPIQGASELSGLPDLIATKLTIYLGPIAAVIVEDYLDDIGPIRDSGALQKMVASIASEISDEGKRDEFIEEVLSHL